MYNEIKFISVSNLAEPPRTTQFLVAPYSLFVSFGLAAALAPQIYMGHYISFALIEGLTATLGQLVLPTSVLSNFQAASSYLYLPIGPTFIAAFFVVDQASCLYIHFCTPSRKFTLQETLIHAVWGFLVCRQINIMF